MRWSILDDSNFGHLHIMLMSQLKTNLVRNGSIDTLRLLMAFIVVVNHTCIFGLMVQDYIDCAVPVFLIISGYYFSTNTLYSEISKIKKTCWKLLKILLGAFCLYIVWDFLKYCIWNEESTYSWNTLWTCRNLFCPPLWYVHSLLYLMLFFLIIDKIFFLKHRPDCYVSRLSSSVIAITVIVLWLLFKIDVMHYIPNDNNFICIIFLFIGILIKRYNLSLSNKRIILWGGGNFNSKFIS